MKRVLMLLAVVSACIGFMSCATSKSIDGGAGGGGTGSATSGNWDIELTSGTGGVIVGFGGHLAFNGASVTGNLMPYSNTSACFLPSLSSTSVPVSGTISNGSLPLNIATNAGTFDLTLTVPTGSTTSNSLSGTYTVTGGCLGSSASGNVSANLVSGALGGTWQGTDSAGPGAVLSFNFTVASTATSSGVLQGTFGIMPVGLNFTPPAGCTVSGATLNADSFAAGKLLFLDVSETENGIPSEFLVFGLVDNATAPANFSGEYQYAAGGSCLLNTSAPTSFSMTKQ